MSADQTASIAAAEAISHRLAVLAGGLEAAATALPGPAAGWSGPAALAATRLLATRPKRFRAAAVACRAAAGALSRHAEALAEVVALRQQSARAPAELAEVLQRRAGTLLAESAQQTARSLLELAGSAPSRRDGWAGRLDQVDTWRAEVLLGAAQSTEALAATAVRVVGRLTNPFQRPPTVDDLRRAGDNLVAIAGRPVEIGKAVLDWETWATNPARAVGHLVPDAIGAIAGGGTAAGVRATTVANQGRAARQFAATRDDLRREVTGAAASAARQHLIQRAEAEALARIRAVGLRGTAVAWSGEGGTRLTALQSAGVEAYQRLSIAQERSLTAIMREVAGAGRGRLAGLDHRLKAPESAKRKLATQHALAPAPLPELLAKAKDAVRYSVVLEDTSYVRGVAEIAATLERKGFHPNPAHNAWSGPRYRGINSVWVDPSTGAAFEVQFHTPASYRVTRQTHGMYEEYRLPGLSPDRKAELHDLIAAEYRTVPIPGWAEALKGRSFPPPSAPGPIPPPAGHSAAAAAAASAGGSTHAAVTERRLPEPGPTRGAEVLPW